MSLLTWLSGYDSENAARADAAEARSRQINDDKAAWGLVDEALFGQSDYGAAWAAKVNQDYATQFDTSPDTIHTAFDEGLTEGRKNVSAFIKDALNRIVADPLRAVIAGLPWWLWVLALGALAFYLWPLIRRLLNR